MPADPQIARFHSSSLQESNIGNSDVYKGYERWKMKTEPTFNCLDEINSPCTVVRKNKKPNGEANIWFFGGQSTLKKGPIYFTERITGNTYLNRVSLSEVNHGQSRLGEPFFSLLKIPTKSTFVPYKWESVIRTLTLTLTDIYGNKGKLQVTWDEENYFDKPRISSLTS